MILFETLNQPKIFIALFIAGFLCGFIFDVLHFIHFLCKKNKIVGYALDSIGVVFSFAMLFLTNLNFNYGAFRMYIFLMFFFALLLQRLTLGKLIAKLETVCYNLFIKFTKLFTKEKKHENKTK